MDKYSNLIGGPYHLIEAHLSGPGSKIKCRVREVPFHHSAHFTAHSLSLIFCVLLAWRLRIKFRIRALILNDLPQHRNEKM